MSILEGGVKQPKIYAYSFGVWATAAWKGQRDGVGVIKVGFTERDDVNIRIKEQINNVKLPETTPYSLLLAESAFTVQGHSFTDHAVHKALKSMGVHRIGKSEWFEASLEEVKAAIYAVKTSAPPSPGLPRLNFRPRPEQTDAVDVTARYFKKAKSAGHAPHFLWNAKMRFGKTFTTYQLAKKLDWKRILVLTYKPAVENSWRNDLYGHEDFKEWRFKGKEDEIPNLDDASPLVWFASFQDVLGTDAAGQPKTKNLGLYGHSWDAIVIDEYHFGAWGDVARELYAGDVDEETEGDPSEKAELEAETFADNFVEQFEAGQDLKTDHFLYLSGTPFRAIAQGEFLEDQIFNWTYSDEQRAKREWKDTKRPNPYAALPTMHILTYEMPEKLRERAQNQKAEFSLTEFFKTKKTEGAVTFLHQNDVQQWLDILRGQNLALYPSLSDREAPPFPYKEVNLREALRHTIWYLPSVDSCTAMQNLLSAPHNTFFNEYTVIKAAGKEAKIGAKALPPVEAAISKLPQETKSITLTCGKLLTGVTVPAWTGIFMLRELKSPETYFQAAFRVQSPWATSIADAEEGGEKQIVLKEHCYVFDFAPNRALSQIVQYALNLGSQQIERQDRETAVRELLDFMPVLAFEGQSMNSLNAEKLIDYLTHGITSSMLAKRWNSPELVNFDMAAMEAVLANEELLASLEQIDDYRAIRDELTAIVAVNKELAPKVQAKEKLGKAEKSVQDEAKKRREDIRQKLRKFIARLPVFMYLTDNREKSISDLITQVEPDLFKHVTQLRVRDFEMLMDARVFNEKKMDDAVWKFREFERPSLGYGLNDEFDEAIGEAQVLGGFSAARHKRLAKLIDDGKLRDGDMLYAARGEWTATARIENYGLMVGSIRYADPSEAAKVATKGAETDGWKFWTVDAVNGSRSLGQLV